jgi:hypothetical protein
MCAADLMDARINSGHDDDLVRRSKRIADSVR